MSAPGAVDRERALRRRHRRERQALLFGVLLAALALAGLGAIGVFTGAISSPFSRDFSTPKADPKNAVAPAPCPPEGSLPVAYKDIQAKVLNSTKRGGLATTTAAALAGRGFTIVGTGNSPAAVAGSVRIGFGASGVGAAYTIAAQFDHPALALDARTDAGVDVIVGDSFETLLEPTAITLDPAAPLKGAAGCVPLADAQTAPAPVVTPAAAAAS